MKARLRPVIGALRILARRTVEAGQPGLRIWTNAGEKAAVQVREEVSAAAHQNEVTVGDWAERIRRMLADRRIDASELAELGRAPAALERCAGRSHDIGEAVL